MSSSQCLVPGVLLGACYIALDQKNTFRGFLSNVILSGCNITLNKKFSHFRSPPALPPKDEQQIVQFSANAAQKGM